VKTCNFLNKKNRKEKNLEKGACVLPKTQIKNLKFRG
jgi:hypothetical protein